MLWSRVGSVCGAGEEAQTLQQDIFGDIHTMTHQSLR